MIAPLLASLLVFCIVLMQSFYLPREDNERRPFLLSVVRGVLLWGIIVHVVSYARA